jgi:molybdate/tungstate transport system permease protein
MKSLRFNNLNLSRRNISGFNFLLAIIAGILVLYITYPIFGIIYLIEPSKLLDSLVRMELYDSLLLSLTTSTISTIIIAIFGIPLAYVLARFKSKIKLLIQIIVIFPLVLPPLVSGTLLLGVFGPYSDLGRMVPVEFTQSIIGIIIAQTYVAAPFLILPAQAAFESIPEKYEIVARTLGKKRWYVFVKVFIPLAKIGIIIGLLMSWIRSIGELGATMMMSYNPHTISIQIFEDSAIGGIRNSVAGIVLVILIAIVALTMFILIRKQSLRFGW